MSGPIGFGEQRSFGRKGEIYVRSGVQIYITVALMIFPRIGRW